MMVQNILISCLHFYFGQLLLSLRAHCSSALSIPTPWKSTKPKEIEIHRIKSPRLRILDKIDIGELHVNDPDLYIDYCSECREHDEGVYHLATWKDESLVIGMVEVLLDIYYYKDSILPDLPGVMVARKHKRKGVGTAILKAVARDIEELAELMDLVNKHKKMVGEEKKDTHKHLELRLCTVFSKNALSFYRAMGFRFAPWIDDDSGIHLTIRRKLRRRLTWTWAWMSETVRSVLFELTYEKPWSWLYVSIPQPSCQLVKRLDFFDSDSTVQ